MIPRFQSLLCLTLILSCAPSLNGSLPFAFAQQVYVRQRDYDRAIESLQRALKLTWELGDRYLEMQTWGSLGGVYLDQGQMEKSVASYQNALAIARELGDRRAEGQASEGIGLAYLSSWPSDANREPTLNRYAKAIAAFQHSLSIARALKDASAQETALNNLGVAYRRSGEYRKSIAYFQAALTLAQELRDEVEQARVLNNLGKAYSALYEYAQALKHFQQSLAIAQTVKHPELELDVLGRLGDLYHHLGDYSQAWQSYQRALRISQYLNDRHTEGRLLNLLGAIYRISGNYEKSIEYRQRSLAIAQEFKDYHWQITNLNDLGTVYSQLNQLSKALEYYQRGLQIAQKQKTRAAEGRLWGSIGLVYLQQGKYPEAVEVLEKGLAIVQEVQDNRRFEASFLISLGIAFNFSNRLEEAERTLRQAMQIHEFLRAGLEDRYKVSLFDIQSDVYENLQQVLVAQNRPEAALEISERGRARAFAELLAQRIYESSGSQLETSPPTPEDIQQIARQQNSTIVEYSIVSPTTLFIWVIQPTGAIAFRKVNLSSTQPAQTRTGTVSDSRPGQISKASLMEIITTTRSYLRTGGLAVVPASEADSPSPSNPLAFEANPARPSMKAQLQRLHQILIDPIADLLPTDPNHHVTFVPQGPLFLVPFAALQDGDGQYLLEKHTILTAPSIQVMGLTRKGRGERRGVRREKMSSDSALIVGNPVMPKVVFEPGEPARPLVPLPGAEQEAKAIAAFLKAPALIGGQATKATVLQQMPNARLIHLATHGLFDERRGIGSSIALSSQQDDGLLTADEILNTRLKAELVVLSACDTGRGRITGDGVIGLSRSILSAGASSVIVSLWAIPDSPTASLMTEFYRQWQKNPDKAQSLRQAMLITKQQHPNPIAWAGFTLIRISE
ncbi:MAG: CHAT domain-containing protein [Leptolyngbyaceae cyanobacterium HOT.MB2.61]|nr:CHAT domain-containing protein [Leptolyngbyaceae cyanobacterium HOT.MB2.61]